MPNRYAIIQATAPIDKNHDGRIDAGELAGAAFKGGLFVTLGLMAVAGFAWSVVWGGPKALRLVLLALSVGMLAGSAIGAWRLLYAIFEIPHRWAADDRRRAIEAEQWERGRLDSLEDEAGDRITQTDLDNAVRLMLLNWSAGKPWQRSSIRGLSDTKWNAANALLKKCGLRRGKGGIEAESFADAWGKYLDWRQRQRSFKVGDDGDLLVNGD